MAEPKRVMHSIPPTYDKHSRVLVLGTMPSPRSRKEGYNYGHPQNRFWRVLAQLADEPVPTTNERKCDFCLRHHIALWDVLAECEIDGASDASIRNAVPNRLTDITKAAPIEAVFCTGAKAYELYNRYCAADVGIPAVKLPSTSPANAACSFERLLAEYAAIFEHTGRFVAPTLPVAEVVALEQAIAAADTPLSELMDRAGTALAYHVERAWHDVRAGAATQWTHGQGEGEPYKQATHAQPDGEAPLVTILCGNGNNGGDGWVAAKLLAGRGVPVAVVTARMPEDLTAQPARDAALASLEELENLGARVVRLSASPIDDAGASFHTPLVVLDDDPDRADVTRRSLEALLSSSGVVVDAILGTGASGRTPRQPFLDWVAVAGEHAHGRTVIACDIPTGIDADTGNPAAPCIVADETITMIVPKPGCAAPESGRVTVAPLAYIEPLLA